MSVRVPPGGVPALQPLSWLYRGGVAVARALRSRPRLTPGDAPRVVAVGNLEVGGSGKTPLALWLVERVMRSGRRAAYASRGFGSAAEHGPLVTVVAGKGAAPPPAWSGVRLVARGAPDLAAAVGDEGALVAARAPAAPLFFARDKRRAVAAAAAHGAEVVVVDDAFQSFALARHVDVLLLDARQPLGGGRVLPAGRLREPPSAIARADVVVFNGAGDDAAVGEARAGVGRWLGAKPRVYGLRRAVTLAPATAAAHGAPEAAVLVSGIAKPEGFRRAVERAGTRVASALVFPDHHRYTAADVRDIRSRGPALVTTEKDWVKLSRFEWDRARVWVARLDVELVGPDAVEEWLLG